VTQAIVHGAFEVEKPALPDLAEQDGTPRPKGTRRVRWGADYADTGLYELTDVRPGNSIDGPAIVESVATTFAIPPGRSARLDRHQIFHLRRAEG
jgi:N-methylhydantoinase A/oxoprolinase/acetone carboxylase beta subunit